jgi:hypothetical protein
MPTDVRLDEPRTGWIAAEATIFRVVGTDLMLDSADRRGGRGGSHRRALVHAPGDTLSINFNRDYSGGVHINDARVNIRCLQQEGGTPQLPANGQAGDLVATWQTTRVGNDVVGETVTLWLCVGVPAQRVVLGGAATWVPLQSGEPVRGTA